MGFVKISNDKINPGKGKRLYRQTYDKDPLPKGVLLFKLNVFYDDQGGWFKENLRTDDGGSVSFLKEQGVNFKIRQSNCSCVAGSSKRFWHIHPNQNEIWSTNSTLLVGLVDLRKSSPTYNVKSKIILSPDKALYIPAGVAHGFINPTHSPLTLTYFTDQHFLANASTQENRIDPRDLPFDFVESELM